MLEEHGPNLITAISAIKRVSLMRLMNKWALFVQSELSSTRVGCYAISATGVKTQIWMRGSIFFSLTRFLLRDFL